MTDQSKPDKIAAIREQILAMAKHFEGSVYRGYMETCRHVVDLLAHLDRAEQDQTERADRELKWLRDRSLLEHELDVAKGRAEAAEQENRELKRECDEQQARADHHVAVTAKKQAKLEAAEQERDEYRRSFACCEVHTPDLWEGDGTCVICEAVHHDDVRKAAEQKHDYAGDPKHCHGCALRAFAKAELRTRVAEQEHETLRAAWTEAREIAGRSIQKRQEAEQTIARLREALTTAERKGRETVLALLSEDLAVELRAALAAELLSEDLAVELRAALAAEATPKETPD